MKRIIFLVIVAGILLAGAWWGYGWWTEGRWLEATDNAYVEADIAVIAPRVAGYVAAVAVEDNQPVKAGDLLVRLEDTDYRARVAATEAEGSQMRERVGAATATGRARTAAIAEARAALVAAEAEARRASTDRDRLKKLLDDGVIGRMRYDMAATEVASRDAAVNAARAAVASARAGETGAGAERGAAVAGGRVSAAQLDAARYDLANTGVRAPVDGVVGNRSARLGQYVRAGQQLMVVVPLDRAYVVANFKETQVAKMRAGQPVRLTADAYPDVAMTGRIASLSPAAGSRFSILPPENATGNFTKVVQRIPVKIMLDRPLPPGVRLVPGLSVRPVIDIRE